MRYLFFIVCIGCFAPFLKGQEADTVYLDDITVSVPAFQRFSAGSNFKNIAIEPYKSQLDDVLAGEGSVYFKTYGNRQLSTISFRGTSSSQTNVLWHGIPANYPTLGQLDFSQWPVWMIESIGVQPGSAGALYGSGSIGGTILLDSEIDPGKDGNQVDLRIEAGSFGYLFTGIKAGYKSGKWSAKSSLFRSYIENDFPYDLSGQEVRQENASALDYGLQQQAVYRTGDHKISFDGMIIQNDREIQPSKFSPDREDRLKTENIRLALEHTWETDKSSLINTLAYLQNDQLYNESDRTKSDQYSFFTSYWLEWNDRISFRTGLNINKFTAASDHYVDSFTDYQTALFASAEVKLTGWWKTVVNLRQSFYKRNQPFTPSLGQEITAFQDDRNKIIFSQNVAWGFRFPTLNDLHWAPGGNPDLQPEESLNAEAAAKWQFRTKLLQTALSVTAFKTWSENWIIWLPQEAIWSPVNFREVEITGLETSWEGKYLLSDFREELKVYYSYTRSLNMTVSNEGNQLPYTPLYNAGFHTKTCIGDWKINLDGNFTSLRYTTLDNTAHQSVDGFMLFDAGIRKSFTIKSIHITTGFLIRNFFDKDYENLINRAMPGRNYQINLSLKL